MNGSVGGWRTRFLDSDAAGRSVRSAKLSCCHPWLQRGHKPSERPQALIAENEELRRENQRLKRRLEQAQSIIE